MDAAGSYSAETATTVQDNELIQLVTFRIGEEEFGVDILKVREINRMMDITRVPKAPYFVEGVVNLRGKVIPVVNLRRRFDMPEVKKDKETRIIVVEVKTKTIGFIVDSVSEVLRVPSDTVEPPPPFCADVDAEYINGVGKLDDKLLIMIDLEMLFATDDGSLITEN